MEVHVQAGSIGQVSADAIVVNLFEGTDAPGGATLAVDQAIGGTLSELIRAGEIKGKLNEATLLHVSGQPFRRVLVVGLGKQADFSLMRAEHAAGTGARALRDRGCKSIATVVHGAGAGGLDPDKAAIAVVKGTLLGNYEGDLHKTERHGGGLQTLILVEHDPDRAAKLEAAAARGKAIGEATNWARDLGNEPGNVLTPPEFARRAQAMADEWGLPIEIFDRAALETMGAGALLAVARGSSEPPQLVVVRHPGKGPLTIFCGKGITFDSGGISIKAREDMHLMKGDMAGAAAVLGAMRAIAATKADVNVVGIAAIAENMPGGRALKPGDVVIALNGKTIEVQNTDAEGRLVLADALSYAVTLGAEAIVDLATLTGACIVALGNLVTGVMGTSPELLAQLRQAGDDAGERMWELPLYPEFREQLKSDVADLRNIGGRPGGAITGGIFLKEFTDDKPWAHLDIVGTSWREESAPFMAKGATGVGIHTLLNLAEERA